MRGSSPRMTRLRADPLAAPHHEAVYDFVRVTTSLSSLTNDPAGWSSRSSTASDGRQSRTPAIRRILQIFDHLGLFAALPDHCQRIARGAASRIMIDRHAHS